MPVFCYSTILFLGGLFFCDTLPGRKSRSFCLSRVVGTLRNAAWPRPGACRSGQGKARNQHIHSCKLFPGRCHARSCFHALRKGMNGPQLAVGVLGTRNTRVFRCYSPGNVPTGAEAFPELFLAGAPLPKAVQPMVSYLRSAFHSLVYLE